MDRLDHADRTGAGAGHRQHHLHFDPGRPVTAETARVRAQDRTVPGDVHAHRAAVPAVVDRRARCALVYAFGSGDFRSRFDPDRWWRFHHRGDPQGGPEAPWTIATRSVEAAEHDGI